MKSIDLIGIIGESPNTATEFLKNLQALIDRQKYC